MFEEKDITPLQCDMQILNILSAFPRHSTSHFPIHNSHETVNKDMPSDFFDGASQGNPTRGGEVEVCPTSIGGSQQFFFF
jgi:hypothetical protein